MADIKTNSNPEKNVTTPTVQKSAVGIDKTVIVKTPQSLSDS